MSHEGKHSLNLTPISGRLENNQLYNQIILSVIWAEAQCSFAYSKCYIS